MRKIGAIFGITALAAVIFCPLPAAAFSIHLGPFYFHMPFVGHHHHHRLQMRANEARTKQSDVSRGGAAKTEQADREARVETNTQAFGSCTRLAPGVTNLPIDQIRKTVHPTADQEAALDNLSAASSQASEVIKSSCPSSVPITPVRRLDAAEQRVDATIKGIQVVRSPFERFYQALNDEQRRQFNAMDGSTKGAHSAGNMADVCSQQAGSFINLPVQRVEQVVQPTAQQQSAFDDLKKTTQNASDKLQSSCPTAIPLSAVARLDTVETRLKAMADAIKSVRPALESFYGSLNDEQKARFNMMGPRAESSQPRRLNGGR
jgi:LTXXQ motif family protein